MPTTRELCQAEDAAWSEFIGLVESAPQGLLEAPGYTDGWSVKDLMAHIGGWQAEAGQVLEQIREGTHRPEPIDVEAMNRRFYEANKDLPLPVVQAELWSARTRMLSEMNALRQPTPEAEEWFRESGAEHYAEHVPRLKEWLGEVQPR